MAFLNKTPAKKEPDQFGLERFAVIRTQLQLFTLSKHYQNRLNCIEAVFMHRKEIAHAAEFPRQFPHALSRLETFKPVQFFLDAMSTLLDEVKKDVDTKPVAVRRSSRY